jgi:FkbM family methyltransferase
MSNAAPIFDKLKDDLTAAIKRRTRGYLQDRLQCGAYIYGAGGFGRRIARLMSDRDIPCLGIIDRRAGTGLVEARNVPVLHPKSISSADCAGKTVVLGNFNPFDDFGEIVRWLRSAGFAEILWGADLPEAFGPDIADFWLSGRQIFIDQFDRIRALGNSLADQTSIDTLATIIRFRALNGDRLDPAPSFGTQYLPDDLHGFSRPITFLDGGAYDGDTLRALKKFGVEISQWLAFEPDRSNFAKLAAFGAICGVPATLMPCGLSDRAHIVQFAEGHDTGSRVLEDVQTGVSVQCVAVDDVFQNVPIDYVKLDIEGAEGAALRGMAKAVQKYRPRLAVSAYHRPADLWDIPLQLSDMMPDGKLYLRHHYPNTFDVVAYAFP